MSKANSNKQSNDNILRASDIIPPYNVPPADKVPVKLAAANQHEHEIPRFDLAEEIMAEQRKITSSRRKKANIKTEEPVEKARGTWPMNRESSDESMRSEQEQIIAEIVEKDIKKLLRNDWDEG